LSNTTSTTITQQPRRSTNPQILNRIFDIELWDPDTRVTDFGVVKVDGECFHQADMQEVRMR
jgi:hypothetical protein